MKLLISGAAVVQVKARDRDANDDPDSPAGQIEYSIVSTHKKFKIDSETGWLSTNTVSDGVSFDYLECSIWKEENPFKVTKAGINPKQSFVRNRNL